MHVARADRPNERLAATAPLREHDQDVPTLVGYADRLEALLGSGMPGIGNDRDRAPERGLDRGDRYPVRLAFVAIGVIPVEPGDPRIRIPSYLWMLLLMDAQAFVNTNGCRDLPIPFVASAAALTCP